MSKTQQQMQIAAKQEWKKVCSISPTNNSSKEIRKMLVPPTGCMMNKEAVYMTNLLWKSSDESSWMKTDSPGKAFKNEIFHNPWKLLNNFKKGYQIRVLHVVEVWWKLEQ